MLRKSFVLVHQLLQEPGVAPVKGRLAQLLGTEVHAPAVDVRVDLEDVIRGGGQRYDQVGDHEFLKCILPILAQVLDR